ncbi:holo-ACP synthase [Phycisphaerales bacterium AB-hyl4]|uniref:Holo-[acyl-carrier-protein] synthase n=1 Tax=Natronomicrosphaera hydrolytica TaxID=3242702 RepID=A0ABV4U2B8_9BACT
MRILGHGIDLVDTPRVAHMLEVHGQRFLSRCFTEGEQAYAAANHKRQVEHLAGRFAAKEAILKALGTGWTGGIGWTDAEVVREPSGRPTVRLHGRCAVVAAEMGIETWWLSITHVKGQAMASAIAVGG